MRAGGSLEETYQIPTSLESDVRKNPIKEEGLTKLISQSDIILRVLNLEERSVTYFELTHKGKPIYRVLVSNDQYDTQVKQVAKDITNLLYHFNLTSSQFHELFARIIEYEAVRIRKRFADEADEEYYIREGIDFDEHETDSAEDYTTSSIEYVPEQVEEVEEKLFVEEKKQEEEQSTPIVSVSEDDEE